MMRVNQLFDARHSALASRNSVGLLAGLCLSFTAGAQAQTGADGATKYDELETVVITAERRETDVQRTPISITAVSGEDLADAAKATIEDALRTVPAVQISGGIFNSAVFIRGLGPSLNTDPAVNMSVDGVYQSDGLVGSQYDVARMEVLRGPQGTLYGRNATAGSVNVINNDPSNTYEASGSLQVGNYNAVRTQAVLNVPLSDTLSVRTAAMLSRHDGYLSNGHQDEDTTSARLKLRYAPSEAVSVLLAGEYLHLGGNGQGNVLAPLANHPGGDPWYSGNQKGVTDARKTSAYAKVDWDLGWGVLTYQPSYYKFDLFWELDLLGNGLGVTNRTSKQHTEELHIASPSSSRIQWIGGLYYLKRDFIDMGPLAARRAIGTGRSLSTAAGTNFTYVTTWQYAESQAAFAQATFPLTDTLRLTGGARYTSDKKTGRGTAWTVNRTALTPGVGYGGGDFINAALNTSLPSASRSRTDKELTWKAAVEFDVTPTSMLYAQVAKGFKSGGINSFSTGLVAGGYSTPTTFEPESMLAYELGSKNRLFNNRLQVNASAYYYDYKDQQIFTIIPQPGGPPRVEVLNAATSTIYGAELEAQWLATRSDNITLNVSYNHSYFDEFGAVTATNLGGNRSDTQEPLAPLWNIAPGYEHVFDLGDHGTLSVSGEMRFISEHDSTIERPVTDQFQPSYHKSDARIVYSALEDKWKLSAFVNNIENEAVRQFGQQAPGAPAEIQLAAPRTYGVTLSARF